MRDDIAERVVGGVDALSRERKSDTDIAQRHHDDHDDGCNPAHHEKEIA